MDAGEKIRNALLSKAGAWAETEWLQDILLISLEDRVGSQPALWHEFIREDEVGFRVVGGVVVTCHSCLARISTQAKNVAYSGAHIHTSSGRK